MFIAPDPALAAAAPAAAGAHHRRGEDDDDDAATRGEASPQDSIRIQSSTTRSPGSDRSGDGEIA